MVSDEREGNFGMERTMSTSSSPVVSELSGYMDLGMHQKAIPLALKILRQPNLKSEELEEAINVLISAHPKLPRCTATVQKAYQGLSIRHRKKVRKAMLSFYYHLRDYPKALLFVSKKPSDSFEYVYSLGVYINLELDEDAARLANMGRKMMRRCKNTLEQGGLLSVLATFFTKRGEFDKAITLWNLVPNELALGFDKFESLTRLYAAKNLQILRENLRELQLLGQDGDPQFEIAYPGLQQKLIHNIKKQLRSFEKSLEQIIPRKDQSSFGLAP